MADKKVSLDSLRRSLPQKIDVFICSASFEERSLVIPQRLAPTGSAHNLVCIDKSVCGPIVYEKAQLLATQLASDSKVVPLKIHDPLATADSLQHTIYAIPHELETTYVVDITTFTHETLLILLRILQRRATESQRIIAVYSAASAYSIGESGEKKWLTRGVREIRSVLGYAGLPNPVEKLHLIVLAGLETERAETLIEACEPNTLSLGYGAPLRSLNEAEHPTYKSFFDRLANRYKDVLRFDFSCDDHLATKRSIQEQIAKVPDSNILIAPLNTKISTVGAALAAFHDDSIQLCYAAVERYNLDSYSVPGDDCYVFDIDLKPSR